MARTWLQIRVELLGGCGIDCDPPPGRVFIVGPSHTFEQLAQAIDQAFARWDFSHLHEFELADGRRIGFPDEEFAPELVWLDHAKLKPARELRPGAATSSTSATTGATAAWSSLRRPTRSTPTAPLLTRRS